MNTSLPRPLPISSPFPPHFLPFPLPFPPVLSSQGGIVVHSGNAQHGHYYSYIRDHDAWRKDGTEKWCKFDDAAVSDWDIAGRLESDCFGGAEEVASVNSYGNYRMTSELNIRNAYLLVYHRREASPVAPPVAPPVSLGGSLSLGGAASASLFANRMLEAGGVGGVGESGMRGMPLAIESIVTHDNFQFLFERAAFHPSYFNFVAMAVGSAAKTEREAQRSGRGGEGGRGGGGAR